jgi:hypothetical protein
MKTTRSFSVLVGKVGAFVSPSADASEGGYRITFCRWVPSRQGTHEQVSDFTPSDLPFLKQAIKDVMASLRAKDSGTKCCDGPVVFDHPGF